MLNGSALLRISVLLIVAGILAALVQFFWPHGAVETTAEPPALVKSRPEVKRVETPLAPQPTPTPQPDRPPQPIVAEAPTVQRPPPAMPEPSPPVGVAPPPAPPIEQPRDPPGQAADNAGPRAVGLVDLNTASVADLNRLRGGGAIGRAIVQKRPYATIDQLLGKRVLSRATYERIKDQVTVQ